MSRAAPTAWSASTPWDYSYLSPVRDLQSRVKSSLLRKSTSPILLLSQLSFTVRNPFCADPPAVPLRPAQWRSLPPGPAPRSPDLQPATADAPMLYHLYWAGPLTAKPFLAAASFLFTQPRDTARLLVWLDGWGSPRELAANRYARRLTLYPIGARWRIMD